MLELASGVEGLVPREFADLLQPAMPEVVAPGEAVSSDELLRAAILEVETAGEAERLEMVAAIATWRWISQVAKTLEIPLEQGVAAWPPDGESPGA